MNIEVQLFAAARDAVGDSPVSVTLSEAATVGELRKRLVQQFPNLNSMAKVLLVAVENEYADDDRSIHESDSVACFPPVSGG